MCDLKERLKNIKLVLFDLDGVLLHNEQDEERIKEITGALHDFGRRLAKYDMIVGILTARENDAITSQLEGAGNIRVLTSSLDKVSLAKKLLDEYNLECKNVFYIGDDLFDIPLLKNCAVSAAPPSARREVRRIVDYITETEKAESMLDELCTFLIKGKENPEGE